MKHLLWITLVGCGSKAAAPVEPAPTGTPEVVTVDAAREAAICAGLDDVVRAAAGRFEDTRGPETTDPAGNVHVWQTELTVAGAFEVAISASETLLSFHAKLDLQGGAAHEVAEDIRTCLMIGTFTEEEPYDFMGYDGVPDQFRWSRDDRVIVDLRAVEGFNMLEVYAPPPA